MMLLILVYAQRPDAKACAPIELWNNRMHCWVNRGAKGIALIDDSSERQKLKVVRGIRSKIIPIVNSLQTIDFFTTKIIFFLPIEKWRKVFIKNPHIWPSPVSRDWRQFLKTKNNFKNHLLKPRFFSD